MEPQARQTSRDVDDASPTDGELVTRAIAGDRKCFDELIVRYQRQAVAVSYRLLGNTQDALEVTQDALGRLPEGVHQPGEFAEA
jgi:DNA-directed RNA polymerase specialized sigma24 family protein